MSWVTVVNQFFYWYLLFQIYFSRVNHSFKLFFHTKYPITSRVERLQPIYHQPPLPSFQSPRSSPETGELLLFQSSIPWHDWYMNCISKVKFNLLYCTRLLLIDVKAKWDWKIIMLWSMCSAQIYKLHILISFKNNEFCNKTWFFSWFLAFINVSYIAQVLPMICPLKLIYSQVVCLYSVKVLCIDIFHRHSIYSF